jgi:hypothetical protein
MKHLFIAGILSLLLLTGYGQTGQRLFTAEAAHRLNEILAENAKATTPDSVKRANAAEFLSIFRTFSNDQTLRLSQLRTDNPIVKAEDIPTAQPSDMSTAATRVRNTLMEEVVVTSLSNVTGSTWQTAAIDGASKFLAKRFKQEIASYYLNTLSDKIDGNGLVKKLFPNTTNFLKQFSGQIYNTDISLLQTAAEMDISNFGENLIVAADEIPYIQGHPIVKSGLVNGIALYKQVKNGSSFPVVFNNIAQSPDLPNEVKPYFTILSILSNSLSDSDPGANEAPWPNLQDIDFGNFEDRESRLYYALLFEQLKNISINGKTLTQHLTSLRTSWTDWFRTLTNVYSDLTALNTYIENQLHSRKEADLLTLLNLSMGLIQKSFALTRTTSESNDVLLETSIKHVVTLYQAFDAIKNKKYTAVIPKLTVFISQLDPNSSQQTILLLRYASIMSQFAMVNNADEMADLLESIALPIGSSSVKRKSQWNVALNGYVGFAYGSERAKQQNVVQTKQSLGLSAPIGIAISKHFCIADKIKKPTTALIPSGTLFLSVFDLGNFVNVRLNNDTTALGNLKFSDAISLGVHYFVNFRNSPFSLGGGVSYVPSYRDIKANNEYYENASVIRYRATLLVDIPFANFFNKPLEEQ